MKRLVALLWLLLPAVVHAQAPQCTAAAPSSIACQSVGLTPQLSDILLGQQGTGPLRPNQTVQWPMSALFAPTAPAVAALLAAPPAIGGTTAAPGNFSSLSVNGVPVSPPGGATTWVQFNCAGLLCGDSTFTFNSSTKAVTIGGNAIIGNASIGGTLGVAGQVTVSGSGNGITVGNGLTALTHNFVYSGTTGAANQVFNITSVITGTSADVGVYGINNMTGFAENQSGHAMAWQSVNFFADTGFYGEMVASRATANQDGTPGVLAAWAPTTAYSTLGQLVQNGADVYALVTAGTSAGSGGPTGNGTNITDGTAHWRFTAAVNTAYQLSGGVWQANAAFSVGGTTSDFQGIVQGGNSVATLGVNATGYQNVVGHEIDVGTTTGSTVFRRAGLQLVSLVAGSQGILQDWGVAIGGQVVSTVASGAFVNPIILIDGGVDPNGYFISAQSQNSSDIMTMAGYWDALRVGATGSGPSGGGFIGRWANGEITNPTGRFAGGDINFGSGSIHVTSTGPVLDAPLYSLSGNPSSLSGGTNWTSGQYAVDIYGNRGTVTASAGVPSAITITQWGNQPAAHNGTATWSSDSLPAITTAGGAFAVTTAFTATEAWTQPSGQVVTLGGVAPLVIGNLGSGTATQYVCATSANQIVVQAGAC